MTARRSWTSSLSPLPGGFLALLPAAKCPVCLAAYGGLLSSLGLWFLGDDRVLAPVVVALLGAGLLGAARTARAHGRPGPLGVTVAGSAALVAGRFVWSAPAVSYGGVALLVGASLWNLWLERPRSGPLVRLRPGRKEGAAP